MSRGGFREALAAALPLLFTQEFCQLLAIKVCLVVLLTLCVCACARVSAYKQKHMSDGLISRELRRPPPAARRAKLQYRAQEVPPAQRLIRPADIYQRRGGAVSRQGSLSHPRLFLSTPALKVNDI